MYLKSIEMQGFKSFAQKIKMDFHDGITGIVGPNGSGKSNISDAVRWVLGEQSARQLRGGNMQDVIFAGTENRKPLGYAYVALTLDNSDHALNIDFDEVKVARRLYRSGESEYLLNGASCRLKDVQELFYDTGIGKDGYSIIGQGRIDLILSGKPEERRELFDEAAGIVKFKRRKRMTLRKLENEQQNLARVTDILNELSRQLGPLERQSEKARIYLQKKEEQKALDITVFVSESSRIEAELTEVGQKRDIGQTELERLQAESESAREAYETMEVTRGELEQAIRSRQQEISNGLLEQQQIESRIALLREQISSAEKNEENLKERLEALDNEWHWRQSEYRKQEEEKADLQKQLEQISEEREKQEKAAAALAEEIAGINAAIQKKQDQRMSLLDQRANMKADLQRLDTMIEQTEIRRAELSGKKLSLKGDENSRREELARLTEERDRLQENVEKKRQENQQLEQEIDDLLKQIEEGEARYEQEQVLFHRESSRLESLQNMAERYEGFGNSTRRIMEQKSRNPGIHGVVAELLQTEGKYETAIETALGGALQNIVTDNESTAKYLIEFLKRGHYGRATFLPLTSMQHGTRGLDAGLQKEPGVIGPADTLVKCEDTYRNLAARLLGKTLVVENIDHAIRLGRKYKHSLRIVTLEGELLNPGGAMTGGSFRNNSNLMGRKREIEELERNIQKHRRAMLSLQGQVEEGKETRKERKLTQAEDMAELQEMEIALNTAEMNLQAALEREAKAREEYQTLLSEDHAFVRQIDEIREQHARAEKELELSVEQENALGEEDSRSSEQLEALSQKETAQSAELEKIRLRYANISQQLQFVSTVEDNIRLEQQRLEQEKQELQKQLAEEGSNSTERSGEILTLEAKRTAAGQSVDENRKTLETQKTEKESLDRQHHVLYQKMDELTGERSRMDRECVRLQAQLEKLEEARERQTSYLWEEYQLTPADLEGHTVDQEASVSSIKKELAELKKEIRALGNVNVNAIEEYKEVRERHDFLQGQYQDLIKAEETLQRIIEELDVSMRRQFKEQFAAIQEEFNKVFRQLFGGGKGSLELMEGEDVLEAGIYINAQPPGKKLQNMMQLSGGEKALTAIALLFAIQNLKPSPFCLLDEIEAALDDANVNRFAGYLHKLTKNTQFIIITHRRGTMTMADRLYGITMQEKGISALVSVDLIESALDA